MLVEYDGLFRSPLFAVTILLINSDTFPPGIPTHKQRILIGLTEGRILGTWAHYILEVSRFLPVSTCRRDRAFIIFGAHLNVFARILFAAESIFNFEVAHLQPRFFAAAILRAHERSRLAGRKRIADAEHIRNRPEFPGTLATHVNGIVHHLFGAVIFGIAEPKAEFQGGHLLPPGRFAVVMNGCRAFAYRIDFSLNLFGTESELSFYRRHRTPACALAVIACPANLHDLILLRAVTSSTDIGHDSASPTRRRTNVIYAVLGLGEGPDNLLIADPNFIFQFAQLVPTATFTQVCIVQMFFDYSNLRGIAYANIVFQNRTAPGGAIADIRRARFRCRNPFILLRRAYANFIFQRTKRFPLIATAHIRSPHIFHRLEHFRAITEANMVRHHGAAPSIRIAIVFLLFHKRINNRLHIFKRSNQVTAAIAELVLYFGERSPGTIFTSVTLAVKQHGRRIIGGGATFARIRDICHLPRVVLTDI